ncbi:MAG: S8 family serine peptidase, partial [Phycisphaerae bacterium]
MKKVTFAVLAYIVVLIFAGLVFSQPQSDINAKVAKLDIGKATLDDVIHIFGEPMRYFYDRETFTRDNLPQMYIAEYPNEFSVVIASDRVEELRFESPATGYIFSNKIQVGSSLDEVLKMMGQPKATVVGRPNKFENGVLYKDIDGEKGSCYYGRKDQGIRLFFLDYKIKALYLTSVEQRSSSETDKALKGGSLQKLESVESVKEFDDVRNKDLSGIDLSKGKKLIHTLQFNQKTIWPASEKMPVGVDPNQLLTSGMNPGLGVRNLHRQGITGKGVNVAIIDQPLYQDHPEFAGKIVAYHDVGCESESSMHGPAVASLLVGANCGTAPDARVYYAAVPSWKRDTANEARALDWIVQQNEKLPVSEKIRVVSVSAAPTSPAVRDINRNMWAPACARAEAAGIMVLDCTSERGFIGACWYDSKVPESVIQCTPGFPGKEKYDRPESILVPSSPRATAEEMDKDDIGYIYWGRGGL